MPGDVKEREMEEQKDLKTEEAEPLELEISVLEIGIHETQILLEGATEQEEKARLRRDLAKMIAHHAGLVKLVEESLPPYEILSEEDLEALGEDNTPEVIEGLLKRGGSMMIVSPGGVIKSWLGQHIAECLASGNPILGRYAVTEGRTLIVDAENLPREIRKRLLWIRNSLGIEITGNIGVLSKVDFLLDNERDVDALLEVLAETEDITIIIDPLIRFHCGNENSSQDMSRVTRALNRIQRELGATLIILQHQTKPGFFAPKGRDAVRGSTELLAWPDTILMADRKDGQYKAQVVKNRYGRDGQTIVFDAWIDEEEGRADFTFIREQSPDVSKRAKAERLVTELLESGGEFSVREAYQALREHKIGEKMVRDTLKALEEEGAVKHRVGQHRKRFYFSSVAGSSSVAASMAAQLEMTT